MNKFLIALLASTTFSSLVVAQVVEGSKPATTTSAKPAEGAKPAEAAKPMEAAKTPEAAKPTEPAKAAEALPPLKHPPRSGFWKVTVATPRLTDFAQDNYLVDRDDMGVFEHKAISLKLGDVGKSGINVTDARIFDVSGKVDVEEGGDYVLGLQFTSPADLHFYASTAMISANCRLNYWVGKKVQLENDAVVTLDFQNSFDTEKGKFPTIQHVAKFSLGATRENRTAEMHILLTCKPVTLDGRKLGSNKFLNNVSIVPIIKRPGDSSPAPIMLNTVYQD